jgi:hypothetical protein
MKKHLLALMVLTSISIQAHAMTQTCPPPIAYRHIGPGAVWEMANEYLVKGWTIAQTPANQNFNGNTSPTNPLHVVLNNVNDTNKFYMTCKSELVNGESGLTVDAGQYIAQADPKNNPNFKKVNDNTYVCETTINHPEACVSSDAPAPRYVNDMTGGSING